MNFSVEWAERECGGCHVREGPEGASMEGRRSFAIHSFTHSSADIVAYPQAQTQLSD